MQIYFNLSSEDTLIGNCVQNTIIPQIGSKRILDIKVYRVLDLEYNYCSVSNNTDLVILKNVVVILEEII